MTIFYLNQELSNAPLLLRALGGTIIITVFEFCVGLVVNLWFGWHIWDYSDVPGNIMGQICPLFSLAWFTLSILLCWICNSLQKLVAGRV